jgi:NADPH:quinone reductase-like Zn-dependent oxidoreductase
LVERAGLAAGQRVLIHGAAGGVGTFAVQLARWRGARVTGTASAANLDFVRGLGADEVIDYRAERFEDVVRDVDVVFDTVGGETLERSWGVLKPGGRLVTVAASGGTDDRRAHPCRVLHRGAEPDAAGGDRTADRRGCAPPGRWRRVPARRGAAGVSAQA